MLRRQVSGAFVCLRCRLQRASIATATGTGTATATRLGAPLSHHIAARHPVSVSRRLYSNGVVQESESSSPDGKPDVIDAPQSEAPHSEAPQSEAPQGEEGIPIHYHPVGARAPSDSIPYHQESGIPRFNSTLDQSLRIYQSRGHRFTPESEDLVVDILGKPGSALVMRGRGQWKRTQLETIEATKTTDIHEEPESLIRHLEREDSDTGIDEIIQNIHELHPGEVRIPHSEFDTLIDKLDKGFTSQQLNAYLTSDHGAESDDPFPTRFSSDPPWVLERQPWIAAVENPDPRIEPVLFGYITKGMPPKRKIAVQILRQCWGVSTYEVLDRDGYLSVKLREVEFGLLMLGQKRWLSSVARDLHPGSQIVVSPSINTISILAPRKSAESILEEINKVLEKARTATFDASLLSADALDPLVLKEVGRITNTIVRLSPSGDQMLVTWIHLSHRPEEFENLGDVVLRYLLYAADTGPRSSVTSAMVPKEGARHGRYVTQQGCEQNMSWMERVHKWSRWVNPAPENHSEEPSQDIFEVPANLLTHPLNEGRGDRPPKPKEQKRVPFMPLPKTQPQSGGWSPRKVETRAVFGHILHAQKQPTSWSLVSPTTSFDYSLKRSFLPVNPPLQSLNFPTNLQATGLYHSILVIRFVPATTQSSVAPVVAAAAPTLELRIELDHKEVKQLMSLRAITGSHTGDVILPRYPVDARLIQTQYVDIDGRWIHDLAPSVEGFLKRSDIRPWAGVVENPPRLDAIQIPKRILVDKNKNTSGQMTPEEYYQAQEDTSDAAGAGTIEKNIHEDSVQIDYMFASRELQRIITADHDGYEISFLHVDAGQRGGQNNELVLDAVTPYHHGALAEAHRKPEDFLKVVSEIASGARGFKWQGKSPDKYLQVL